ETPSPAVGPDLRARLFEAAVTAGTAVGYVNAGTVECLVQPGGGGTGEFVFLVMNTRLQVEHPVTEETSGIDLVREQFRIAEGEHLRFDVDPSPRGHSFEFRINGEDPGRNFLPAPGTVTTYQEPGGPGVRVDSGIEPNSVIGGAFDSLLAKLIVTGENRDEALARARRALDEFVIEGMATALPFHRAVVRDDAFTADPFRIFTQWIETEFDNQIQPFDAALPAEADAGPRETIVVEVGGKRLEVSLPAGFGGGGGGGAARKTAPKRTASKKAGAVASGDSLTAPMQGTIVKIAVEEGDTVEAGQPIVVLEAMKMEQPLTAHKAGTVTNLKAEVGAVVTSGAVICEIKD
ncbi:MAG TPA: biotin/lipoyl-containing protein, partial [Jatrophihabitans sp.]|nr:biotin/lipoyl-containing protein [Jatrophihabitans sp.]